MTSWTKVVMKPKMATNLLPASSVIIRWWLWRRTKSSLPWCPSTTWRRRWRGLKIITPSLRGSQTEVAPQIDLKRLCKSSRSRNIQINRLGRSNEARGERYRDKRSPRWKCDHRCTQALTIISREVAEEGRWCSLKTTLMGTTSNHRWRSQARIIRSCGATSMDLMVQ